MAELRNLTSQAELKKRLENDPTPRQTLSFYRYFPVENPQNLRDELYRNFSELGVLGRVYVASEGINAQLSVPKAQFENLKAYLDSMENLRALRLNLALEDDGKSFWVLSVKVRPKIVADGIDDPDFSMERRGKYLDAAGFNALTDEENTLVVDMRNYYEYEIGHFDGALEVSTDTFREQLPRAVELLADQRNQTIVMYCTGGIRCEKASAYLLHHGFMQVYHLEGGILEYARQVREQGLENKFRGKNFVFDDRLGEQVGTEIISRCHGCEELCDTHHNCSNEACHLLFLQCESCAERWEGCCSAQCHERKSLSPEAQMALPRTENAGFSGSGKRARKFDLK